MTTNYLFELGLEEMPAHVIKQAQDDLIESVAKFFKEERISFKEIKPYSTPRRLGFRVLDIALKQEDKEEEIKGPSKKIAQTDDGEWSKAAIGFTKGQGLSVDDIVFKEVNGEEYVFVKKFTPGKDVREVIKEISNSVENLHFPVSMRWANNSYEYIRPVHWLVSVLDDEIVPLKVFDLEAGNLTRGLRGLGQEKIEVNSETYLKALKDNYVIADREERQRLIKGQLLQIEDKHQWTIPTDNQVLLDEVTDLVEYPTAFYGNFDKDYLKVPSIVLKTAMADHQRYFPVFEKNSNKMLNHFISVRNGDGNYLDQVIKGNEKVLIARLEDAKFFYENDLKESIDTFKERLKNVTFQEKLGSLYDKQERVKVIARFIGRELKVSEDVLNHVIRASDIYKFDLETGIVKEFTSLQGKIGTIIAQEKGEPHQVAEAIEQSYMPTLANGDLPYSKEGIILSLAEKIDTLLGFFALGIIPSGSNDPNALRRQALGLVRILKEMDAPLSLPKLVESYFVEVPISKEIKAGFDEYKEEFYNFIDQRIDQLLKEEGYNFDIRQAVLESNLESVGAYFKVAQILEKERQGHNFKEVVENLTRISNLAKKESQKVTFKEKLAETESEKALMEQSNKLQKALDDGTQAKSYYLLLEQASPIIADFFENNMVMVDDNKLKDNRLGLIAKLNYQVKAFADFSQLVI